MSSSSSTATIRLFPHASVVVSNCSSAISGWSRRSDWANSPRTFDTVADALWRSLNWHLDAFWCRPNIILPRQLDEPNSHQQFFGLYAVYQGFRNQVYDLYYLGFDQEKGPGITFNGEAGDLAIQTFGTRWQGQSKNLLWEGEAAYQFGHHRNLPRPPAWLPGESAIGSPDGPWSPNSGSTSTTPRATAAPTHFGTFNQLFPFGHKFFGYMDIVGRPEHHCPERPDPLQPGAGASLLLWYYNFHPSLRRDALYNAAGTPIRFDPTGRAGRYVGDELDIVLSFVMNPHSDWQIGVSHFWAGPFVQRTANTPARPRADRSSTPVFVPFLTRSPHGTVKPGRSRKRAPLHAGKRQDG